RALAMTALAELYAQAGDYAAAKSALDAASRVAPELPTIETLRESIARKRGMAALGEAVFERRFDPKSRMLAGAAKLAITEDGLAKERELLLRAFDETGDRTAEILLFDVVAKTREDELARSMLEKEWSRAQEQSPGSLLALLDVVPRGRTDDEKRRALLL